MKLRPITLREANGFVARNHRHHAPVRGCVFCVALWRGEELVGVAIVGRPVARNLDDGETLEVTRLCVLDGIKNACSKLLSAVTRACQAIGCARVVSYTLESEGGGAWVASGWTREGETGGGTWSRPSRARGGGLFPEDHAPEGVKVRWSRTFAGGGR